jgi:excisionase family DNA binding protein
MVQYYTLEQAAQLLRISPDKLKEMVNQRKIRAFQDRGTLRFRTQEIDELVRSKIGSDSELPLADPPSKPGGPTSSARKRSKVAPTPPDDEESSDDFDFSLSTDDEPSASRKPSPPPAAKQSGPGSGPKRAPEPKRQSKLSPPPRSSDSDVRLVADGSDLDFQLSLDDNPAPPKSPSPGRKSRLSPGGGKPPSSKTGAGKSGSARKKDSSVRLTPPEPGSDSDVKIVPDDPADSSVPIAQQPRSKAPSDSDIRLEGASPKKGNPNRPGSDPIITEEIDLDQEAGNKPSAKKKSKGKGAELPTTSPFELSENDLELDVPAPPAKKPLEDSSSDFELTPLGSSEIELGSDEKEALADDEEMNLEELSGASGASGINLQDPVDSGISLEADGSDEMEFELTLDDGSTPKPSSAGKLLEDSNSEFELSLDDDPSDEESALPSDSEFELSLDESSSSELALDDGTDSASDSEFELTLDEEGALSPVDETSNLAEEDKDLFEETDFDVPSLDEESGSEAMALDESSEMALDDSSDMGVDSSSDFDLAVDDSALGEESDSQVVPLEGDEDADVGAETVARPMAKRKPAPATGDESDRLDIDLETAWADGDGVDADAGGEEDESELAAGPHPGAVAAPPAEWGVLPAIFMFPCVIVLLLVGLMSWELVQGMWGYHKDTKYSGIIIRTFAGMFDDSLPKDDK